MGLPDAAENPAEVKCRGCGAVYGISPLAEPFVFWVCYAPFGHVWPKCGRINRIRVFPSLKRVVSDTK